VIGQGKGEKGKRREREERREKREERREKREKREKREEREREKMANRTGGGAVWVHGTNPQYLVEKIIRSRIYGCLYWKSECFGLNSETILDKAVGLDAVGGVFGKNQQPTPFICLTLKLLQLQPEKPIILRFLEQDNFKYLRALAAFYLRLVGSAEEIYQYLEPFYNDYRKLRRRTQDGFLSPPFPFTSFPSSFFLFLSPRPSFPFHETMLLLGSFDIIHVDEFIDELLTEESSCQIALPRLTKRNVLEETGKLEIRRSALEEDLEEEEMNQLAESKLAGSASPNGHASDDPPRDSENSEKREKEKGRRKRDQSRDKERRRSRSRDRRDRSRSQDSSKRSRDRRDRSKERERRDRSRERGRRDRGRSRSRSRSRDRGKRDRSKDRAKHMDRSRDRSRSREKRRDRSREKRRDRDRSKEREEKGDKSHPKKEEKDQKTDKSKSGQYYYFFEKRKTTNFIPNHRQS